MEITVSTVQARVPVSILRLKGDLDANTADQFSAAALQAIQNGPKDMLVDLSQVPFMSSAGIRALHALYTTLDPIGSESEKDAVYKGINAGTYSAPHLKLLKPNKKVDEVIRLAGLDMYLKPYNSEEEALAAF